MQRYSTKYSVSMDDAYFSSLEAGTSPNHKRNASYEEDTKNGKRHCTEIEDEYDAIGKWMFDLWR